MGIYTDTTNLDCGSAIKGHTEPTITLLDGRTLACYPKAEPDPQIDNRWNLDSTGQYLTIGRQKPVVKPTPPEEEQATQYFADYACFLFAHRERILSDSRMFLAPVTVNNHLAYTGTSGFRRPTLGVYIEWWMQFAPAIISNSGDKYWLLYFVAGSPLSGSNRCGIVNRYGESKYVRIPGKFTRLWAPFIDTNKRYDEAKELYEAYSLKEVVKILFAEGEADNQTESALFLLQREDVLLLNDDSELLPVTLEKKKKIRRKILKTNQK